MANKIQVRRGTKAQLTTYGPLAIGEPGYATDTKELFVGNGSGANTLIGVSNPWGDNTTSQRSTVWAYLGSALSTSANVWTTIAMSTKDADNLSEYNSQTGAFTAKNSGWYLVNVRATLLSAASGITTFLRLLKDGSIDYRLDLRMNTAATAAEVSASGSVLIYCVVGSTITPQILTTLNSSLVAGSANTRFEVIRVS